MTNKVQVNFFYTKNAVQMSIGAHRCSLVKLYDDMLVGCVTCLKFQAIRVIVCCGCGGIESKISGQLSLKLNNSTIAIIMPDIGNNFNLNNHNKP